MLSPEVILRIGKLQREQPASAELSGSTLATAPPVPSAPTVSTAPPLSTSTLPEGREVHNSSGTHWECRSTLSELWPQAQRHLQQRQQRLAEQTLEGLHPDLQQLGQAFPDGALFLDLETCGFAGSMVFLVGTLELDPDGRWILHQLLARNYAEEAAVLQTLWQHAARKRVLGTFNGKSFDWPVVHDRSTLHRLGIDPRDRPDSGDSSSTLGVSAKDDEETEAKYQTLAPDMPRPHLQHCDLLHHSRRRWKTELPNCRLQTLERYLCGRQRNGDIPGRDIPAAYHDFVRSGDAWQLKAILHHNALDLITLLQISLCLLTR